MRVLNLAHVIQQSQYRSMFPSESHINLCNPLLSPSFVARRIGIEKAQAQLAALFGLYLWDHIDGKETRNLASRYKPFPVPNEDDSYFIDSDVSIVVPTVDWDENLTRNLLTWLACTPREVIFVTTERLREKLQSDLDRVPAIWDAIKDTHTSILVITVQEANKRIQLCRGINKATGQIIALVDDDARWTTDQVMNQLLAPFEDEQVGLVGGPIGSYVPEERRDPKVITPWEVAALRIRQRRGPGMAAFFAADGSTNFTISGLTMFVRATIVKDPYFQYCFTYDLWGGVRQNTGDDSFITRYVLFQHLLPRKSGWRSPRQPWKLGIQLTPQAEVQTSIMTDNRFAAQSKRWYRSGLRLRLTCLLQQPGFLSMYKTTPYMARKMCGGMINPILTAIRLYLWCCIWLKFPLIATIWFLYVLYNWYSSLLGFYRQFPYCGSKIWAAMIADNLYLVSDIYSYLTLSVESWSNRSSVRG
ncbi:glycosyltransferase family 2 protein [Hypoxylon sp. FL0890]|nr:glycosyltransferase family 2 protein [Hypoxylon sp. FL0890]